MKVKRKKKLEQPSKKFSDKAVRTTSINPYFRDKFQFRKRKVYFSREYAVAKSRERSRLLNLQVRALSKLKPKKADRGKLVFYRVKIERKPGKVTAKVTRVRGTALLKTPVFVLKGGKKRFRVLNPYDPKTLAKGVRPRPSAQRLDVLDVRRIRQRPVDYVKYLEKTEKLYRKKFITKPVTEKVLKTLKTKAKLNEATGQTWFTVRTPGGNLDPFYKSVISIWTDRVKNQRKQMSWRVKGYATLSNGKVISFEPQSLNSNRFFELSAKGLTRAVGQTAKARRVYSTPFMFDLYSRYLHSGLAGALGEVGLVSQSSIRRIKSRPYNFGKTKSKWTTETTDGSKIEWPGKSKKPVEITSITYTLNPSGGT
jgi:hypothetical protein